MNAWLIYCREDIEKNKKSIEIFKENFLKYGFGCELIIFEEILDKLSEIHKCPDIVINRSRSLELAEYFQNKAGYLYNSPLLVKLGNDKVQALEFVQKAGLKIMEYYNETEEIPNYPVVAKTKSGHGGNEVFLVKSKEEADKIKSTYKDIFFQKYSEQGFEDMRVYIVGGKIFCAIKRHSDKDFRSNYSLGGEVNEVKVPEDVVHQVNKLICEIGEVGYCGIDFIKYKDMWVFNEIEDVVGARSVYSVTEYDPIGEFVSYCAGQYN